MNAVTEKPRARRRIADEFPERVQPSKFAHAVLTTPDLPSRSDVNPDLVACLDAVLGPPQPHQRAD